ncbi:MAG: 2Fe-2S iron-sulfur cluster-binding protein [Candidatus Woesearchaeota archaeon]
MAKLQTDIDEVDLDDNSPTMDAAMKLGVPFGCSCGTCGVCGVEVVEGMENLSEMTENEELMAFEENQRFMCQCKIKKGNVKIRF